MVTRKWGSEFVVNTTTAGNQSDSAVTALADGGFAIAWTDENPLDDLVRWQRFNATGVRVGSEFVTNSFGGGGQFQPAIASLSGGGIWVAQSDFDTDRGNKFNVIGEVFSPTGASLRLQDGGVGTLNGMSYHQADVASLGTSGSVIAYTMTEYSGNFPSDRDLVIKGYDALGNVLFSEVMVNPDSSNNATTETAIKVAANPAGTQFAVVWKTSSSQTVGRVYNANGTPAPGTLDVNTQVLSERAPDIAWIGNDRIVVVWENGDIATNLGGDGSGSAIRFTIFESNGTTVVSQVLANTSTRGNQGNPVVTGLADGGFVIAWEDSSLTTRDSSGTAIRLQVYNSIGEKMGGEVLVNTATAGSQLDIALTTLADDRVLVSWTDASGAEGDTSGSGIRAQIIDPRDGLITGSDSPVLADLLYGNDAANDEMNGLAGNDTLFGLSGADVLFGGEGNDTLNGGRGDDTLYGGQGSDILIGGLGADDLFGGSGTDTLNFNATRGVGVTADLLLGFGLGGEAEGDSYLDVENIIGSHQNDVLTLRNIAGRLDGLNGDDDLTGGSSNDAFFGGAGADTMNGLAGVDRVYYSSSTAVSVNLVTNINTGGEALGDTLNNIEEISGSSQGDTIIGNNLNNRFFGQNGDDTLSGGTGIDTLVGGTGSDTFRFATGDSGQTGTSFDTISDYAKGLVGTGDRIDFASNLTIGGSDAPAQMLDASINASTGVATFGMGGGMAVNDSIQAIATRFTAAGDAVGEFALFQASGSPFYIFISDGIAGVSAGDVLVQLAGIMSINSIGLTGGDLTLLS